MNRFWGGALGVLLLSTGIVAGLMKYRALLDSDADKQRGATISEVSKRDRQFQIDAEKREAALAGVAAKAIEKNKQDDLAREKAAKDEVAALKRAVDESERRIKAQADAHAAELAKQVAAAGGKAAEAQAKLKELTDKLTAIGAEIGALKAAAAKGDASVGKRLAALERDLRELQFPSLAADAKPLFEVRFESVGHMAKTDHLALVLVWPEPQSKPPEKFLEFIRLMFVDTGTQLDGLKMLHALDDATPHIHVPMPAEGAKHLMWYPAWVYVKKEKDHVPIAFTYVEWYPDRARVYWYPERRNITPKHMDALRLRLLVLAEKLGRTTEATARWAPRIEGYSDLYFK